jgi:hypothetical protein
MQKSAAFPLAIPLLIAIFIVAWLASTQLQPELLKSLHAAGGSFGIRPMSHRCIGLKVESASIDWLPAGDFSFTMGRFLIRYRVEENISPWRTYCIGQDVWYGE